MNKERKVIDLKKWWNSLLERKAPLRSSANPTLTSSGQEQALESQALAQVRALKPELYRPVSPLPPQLSPSDSQLSHPRVTLDRIEVEKRLYWCCFIDPFGGFKGVVISRGISPGTAANKAIESGLVDSQRANIVAIPYNREGEFEKYANRLLSLEEVLKAFPTEPFVRKYLDMQPPE